MPKGLPFRLTDYLELLDWTGRILVEGKRGAISRALPPILERLQIDPRNWLQMAQHFEGQFRSFVGAMDCVKATCRALGYRRTPNLHACRVLLT